MEPEAAFLTGYSFVLVAVAIGLEALGRRSTEPWASPILAASRPPARQPSEDEPDWPHSEVPAFHLGLAAVALVAAFVITALSTARHPWPTELVVHGALLVIITVRIRHVIIEWRTPSQLRRRATTPAAERDV